MANDFQVEWVEKGQTVRGRAQLGNFDGDEKEAEREIARIWGDAMPERTQVRVVGVTGAGRVARVGAEPKPGAPAASAPAAQTFGPPAPPPAKS